MERNKETIWQDQAAGLGRFADLTIRPAADSPPRRDLLATAMFDIHDTIPLDRAQLEGSRIVSFDSADDRSLPFRVLGNEVRRSMEERDWRVLGVTAPTAGCGTSVT